MGWSHVGIWAATLTEITVQVLGWSFAVAVVVPTITVTMLGGNFGKGRLSHESKVGRQSRYEVRDEVSSQE